MEQNWLKQAIQIQNQQEHLGRPTLLLSEESFGGIALDPVNFDDVEDLPMQPPPLDEVHAQGESATSCTDSYSSSPVLRRVNIRTSEAPGTMQFCTRIQVASFMLLVYTKHNRADFCQ